MCGFGSTGPPSPSTANELPPEKVWPIPVDKGVLGSPQDQGTRQELASPSAGSGIRDACAYPAATEDMVAVLTRDSFVDALQDQELQLYIKQARPDDVQAALPRSLEMKAFLHTTMEREKDLDKINVILFLLSILSHIT